MASRKALRVFVTIVVLGAAFALWGFRGIVVYLGIKLLALVILGLLWVTRQRLFTQDRSKVS
jgi:hypothetical protein